MCHERVVDGLDVAMRANVLVSKCEALVSAGVAEMDAVTPCFLRVCRAVRVDGQLEQLVTQPWIRTAATAS